MNETVDRQPPPLGFGMSFLIPALGALLLWFAGYQVISWLRENGVEEPALAWFLAGGIVFFGPLVLIGFLLLACERRSYVDFWHGRLWFRALSPSDWAWSLGGLLLVGLLSSGMMAILRATGENELHPSFVRMEPFTPDRYWLFAAWAPFFFLNIMGETFLWHSVMLPRQQTAFGRWAWLISGFGWLLVHVPFGPAILCVFWPTVFIIPYVVQRTANVWPSVVIHAGVNGPGFVAVAFGLV